MAVGAPSPSSIVASSSALTALNIIAVGLRFWARSKQRSRYMMDDWFVIPALLLTIGMAAALIAGVRLKAFGYPTKTVQESTPSQEIEWFVQMMQTLALGFVKLSFLFFFRRIFVVSKSSMFAIGTMVMTALVVLWTVSFFFGFLFICKGHFAAWWSSIAVQRRECTELDFENAFALSDFLMDAIIMLMPIPMVWRLHMSTGRKLAVTAIFSLGSLAVIASIVRLAIFYWAKAVAFKSGIDNDLLITRIVFWSMIESELALLAVCLPSMQNLFSRASLEAAIRSVRDVVSLASGSRDSQGSRGSRPSRATVNGAHADGNGSTTSHARMVPNHVEPNSIESYVMSDLSKKPDDEDVPQGEIFVSQRLEQSHTTV